MCARCDRAGARTGAPLRRDACWVSEVGGRGTRSADACWVPGARGWGLGAGGPGAQCKQAESEMEVNRTEQNVTVNNATAAAASDNAADTEDNAAAAAASDNTAAAACDNAAANVNNTATATADNAGANVSQLPEHEFQFDKRGDSSPK